MARTQIKSKTRFIFSRDAIALKACLVLGLRIGEDGFEVLFRAVPKSRLIQCDVANALP